MTQRESPDRGGPVMDGLRMKTHEAHVRINKHPLLYGLTRPGYPLDNYRAILTAYFHLYCAIEARIDKFLARDARWFDYSERRKLPWIALDLEYLDGAPPATPRDSESPAGSPDIGSVGQLIGVLYTIEGSTLGGQVISRHLESHHRVTKDRGARFFHGYGERTVPQWQEFSRFAESIRDDPVQRRLAEAAASRTFAQFEEVLDAYQRSRG